MFVLVQWFVKKNPTNRRTDARQGVTKIAHVFNSRGELIWHLYYENETKTL